MLQDLRSARSHVIRELSEWFKPNEKWHRPRLAAAAAVAVALALAGWLAMPKPNLALGRPAKASGQAFGTSPAGAVDGLRYGQLGFHSGEENHPWLVVDLGEPRSVSRVTVFGRADCCFDQSIPLLLELALDADHFERAGRRTKPFTQFDPWEVALPRSRAARYVRLRAEKRGPLVLSEIEVNGR